MLEINRAYILFMYGFTKGATTLTISGISDAKTNDLNTSELYSDLYYNY